MYSLKFSELITLNFPPYLVNGLFHEEITKRFYGSGFKL